MIENIPMLHTVELWDGPSLVAGEVGVAAGSVYTSLSGFHLVDGMGSIQLWALFAVLRLTGEAKKLGSWRDSHFRSQVIAFGTLVWMLIIKKI